jgi:serralysin
LETGYAYLRQVGNNYFVGGNELSFDGTPVTAGEFAGWQPIAVVGLADGSFDVAWENASAGLYTVWNVNGSFAYTGSVIGVVSGTSSALENLEATFRQDLNLDSMIGPPPPPPPAVISVDGSTSLTAFGGHYFLYAANTTTGPELSFGGMPVTVGEFAGWAPIGAVAVMGGGYDVAWENGGGLFTAWSVNSNGAYTGSIIGVVSGSSSALENLETTFNQDLNLDAAVGPPPPTVINTAGSTDLAQAGNNYFLFAHGTTTGPELSFGGTPVTVGEFAGWTPIGAVAVTGGGYDVAWKDASTGLYTAWSVDSSGAYTGSIIGVVPGSNNVLENLETTFNQDLNLDGTIGPPPPPPPTVIKTDGSTDLAQVANNYFLFAHGTATGPELSYGGGPVTVGEFAGWTPIGAAAVTGGGYDVAWENASTGLYTLWSVNSSGAYTGSIVGVVSGSDNVLENLENTFNQDLNLDGTIGPPAMWGSGYYSSSGAGTVTYAGGFQNAQALLVNYLASPLVTSSDSSAIVHVEPASANVPLAAPVVQNLLTPAQHS